MEFFLKICFHTNKVHRVSLGTKENLEGSLGYGDKGYHTQMKEKNRGDENGVKREKEGRKRRFILIKRIVVSGITTSKICGHFKNIKGR